MACNRVVCLLVGESAESLPQRTTYERLKRTVLSDGRFSIFEATSTPRRAKLYERLVRDPDVMVEDAPFPWTKVRPNGVLSPEKEK